MEECERGVGIRVTTRFNSKKSIRKRLEGLARVRAAARRGRCDLGSMKQPSVQDRSGRPLFSSKSCTTQFLEE